jgi:hypothetical protein
VSVVTVRTKLSLTLPDARALRAAPERSTLRMLDVVLAVAEHALHAEHPSLDNPFEGRPVTVTPTLVAAFLLARRFDELRELLAVYDGAVRDALGEERDRDDDDLPF